MEQKRYKIEYKIQGCTFTQIEYTKTDCLKTVREMWADDINSITITVEPK